MSVKLYRMTVDFEAIKYLGDENIKECAGFCNHLVIGINSRLLLSNGFTAEEISVGDWIVKCIEDGEYRVMSDFEFQKRMSEFTRPQLNDRVTIVPEMFSIRGCSD